MDCIAACHDSFVHEECRLQTPSGWPSPTWSMTCLSMASCCCRVPSLKRLRNADASLAEGQDPKRSKPAIDGIQGSLSNPSSMQASPEAHAIANGSAALQADNGLPQSVAHLPEADGGSEHRSHRKHRHKHHRKDREASAKPLGVTHQQEKRHSSSSHKVWLAATLDESIRMPLITHQKIN